MDIACAIQKLLQTGNIHYYSRARWSFMNTILFVFGIKNILYKSLALLINKRPTRARIIMGIPCAIHILVGTGKVHYYCGARGFQMRPGLLIIIGARRKLYTARWNFRTQGWHTVSTSGHESFNNCLKCILEGKTPTRPTIIMDLSCAMQVLLQTGNIHYYSRARCSFINTILYLFLVLRI